jgi:hypothetical protein
VVAQSRRLARQGDEDLLRDIVGGVGIAANPAERRGSDQGQVALDQLGEGGFGVVLHEPAEQFGIGIHRDLSPRLPPKADPDKIKHQRGPHAKGTKIAKGSPPPTH